MIVRTKKDRNYTVIDNNLIEDTRLSWEARGIAVYLLSKPDDWRINSRHLMGEGPAGRQTVMRALGELEKFGYLRRARLQNKCGQFCTESWLYERPQTDAAPSTEKPALGATGTRCDRHSAQPASGQTGTRANRRPAKPASGATAPILNPDLPIPDQLIPDRPSPDQPNPDQPNPHTPTAKPVPPRASAPKPSLSEEEILFSTPTFDEGFDDTSIDEERGTAMLCAAGVSVKKARSLAAIYPYAYLLAHAAAYDGDAVGDETLHPGALVWRITEQKTPRPPESGERSPGAFFYEWRRIAGQDPEPVESNGAYAGDYGAVNKAPKPQVSPTIPPPVDTQTRDNVTAATPPPRETPTQHEAKVGPVHAPKPAPVAKPDQFVSLWKTVLGDLQEMPQAAWLAGSRLSVRGNAYYVYLTETAHIDWLQARMAAPVERLLAARSGQRAPVRFVGPDGKPSLVTTLTRKETLPPEAAPYPAPRPAAGRQTTGAAGPDPGSP